MAGSMSTSNSDLSKKICAMCKHADCDLDMVGGCGCSFHAVSLLVAGYDCHKLMAGCGFGVLAAVSEMGG